MSFLTVRGLTGHTEMQRSPGVYKVNITDPCRETQPKLDHRQSHSCRGTHGSSRSAKKLALPLSRPIRSLLSHRRYSKVQAKK